MGWWSTLDPTITFDFGQDIDFETIAIHVNNSENGSVGMFGHADLSFSSDGENFGDGLLYTASSDELSDPSARFIVVEIPRTARYVRVALDHRPGMYWLFISEIQFTGTVEAPCPADLNDDGKVNIDDLFVVLGSWGACDDCPEDLNDDGKVNIDDLFLILSRWGPCP